MIRQEPKPVAAAPEPKGKAVVPAEDKNVSTQAPRKDAPSKAMESAVVVPERAVSGKEEPVVKKGVPEKGLPPVVDKPKPQPEAVKKDTAQAAAIVKQVDTMTVKQDTPKEPEVSAPVVTAPPVVREAVERPRLLSQRSGAGGNTYTFLAGPLAEDTVDVWIAVAAEEKVVPAEKLTEQAKADIAADLGTAPAVKKDSVVAVVPVAEKVRTDCKARATAKDVDALKKRLGGVRDEDEKVAAALAGIKARCYDTEQLKALCGAFARNEGKYKLMDAAYPYIYDPGRYGELEGLLTDPYFVHRLKVLTGAINR